MNLPANTMENKDNMILGMIRKINAAVLNYILTTRLRTIGAVILGALGGLSLVSNIIPSALEYSGVMDSFSARWEMGGFASYAMIVWAIGARSAQRIGSKLAGATILGVVGCASALVISVVAFSAGLATLLPAGAAGLGYGAFAGLLIADAFRSPYIDPNDPDAPRGTIGEMGIFRNLPK